MRDYAQAYGVEDFDEFRAILSATDSLVLADIEAAEARRTKQAADAAGARP